MKIKETEDLFRDISELFKPALLGLGATEEEIPSILRDINRRLSQRLATYKLSRAGGDMEDIRSFFSDIPKQIAQIVKDHWDYHRYKEAIKKTYLQTGDWSEVLSTDVYSDVQEAQEAFIDYLEEVAGTKITDVAQLQALTGITHLDSYKKGKLVPAETEAEAKENAIRELTETLTRARYSKYSRALGEAITDGAKHKDLLQIKPQDYGLPESWTGTLGEDQYSAILWAISLEFLINEPAGLTLFPDLRSIAKEMEAPYSVLMDCHKISNRWRSIWS
jgi:hypothetical protein